eukprot:5158404-Prymnesium_polylepis.1
MFAVCAARDAADERRDTCHCSLGDHAARLIKEPLYELRRMGGVAHHVATRPPTRARYIERVQSVAEDRDSKVIDLPARAVCGEGHVVHALLHRGWHD